MTTPTHQFNLDLAKLGWPLISRDGRAQRLICSDLRSGRPIVIAIANHDYESVFSYSAEGYYHRPDEESNIDSLLSADYTNPVVRVAVQKAHETLGMEVILSASGNKFQPTVCPLWNWGISQYRLAIHQPAEPAWQLPAPPEGKQWHRTDGWTREMLPDVTDGGLPWRPLLASEIDGKTHYDIGCSFGGPDCFDDNEGWEARDDGAFYRTRRPLPAAPAYWVCADDVPMPWPVMTQDGSQRQRAITAITESGLYIAMLGEVPWSGLKGWLHFTISKTWSPCTK